MTRLFDEAEAEAGIPRAVVHLVGGFRFGRFADLSDGDWSYLMALNLETTFRVFRESARRFEARRRRRARGGRGPGGAARRGGCGGYAAAKAGVLRMVEALAREVAPSGARANAVLPGTMDTPANRAAMPGVDPCRVGHDRGRGIRHPLPDDSRRGRRQRRRRAGPRTNPMSHALECHVYYDSTQHPEPPASCGHRVDLATDPTAGHQLMKLGISPRADLPAVLMTEPGGKLRIVALRLSPDETARIAGGSGVPAARLQVFSSSWCPDCRRAKRRARGGRRHL